MAKARGLLVAAALCVAIYYCSVRVAGRVALYDTFNHTDNKHHTDNNHHNKSHSRHSKRRSSRRKYAKKCAALMKHFPWLKRSSKCKTADDYAGLKKKMRRKLKKKLQILSEIDIDVGFPEHGKVRAILSAAEAYDDKKYAKAYLILKKAKLVSRRANPHIKAIGKHLQHYLYNQEDDDFCRFRYSPRARDYFDIAPPVNSPYMRRGWNNGDHREDSNWSNAGHTEDSKLLVHMWKGVALMLPSRGDMQFGLLSTVVALCDRDTRMARQSTLGQAEEEAEGGGAIPQAWLYHCSLFDGGGCPPPENVAASLNERDGDGTLFDTKIPRLYPSNMTGPLLAPVSYNDSNVGQLMLVHVVFATTKTTGLSNERIAYRLERAYPLLYRNAMVCDAIATESLQWHFDWHTLGDHRRGVDALKHSRPKPPVSGEVSQGGAQAYPMSSVAVITKKMRAVHTHPVQVGHISEHGRDEERSREAICLYEVTEDLTADETVQLYSLSARFDRPVPSAMFSSLDTGLRVLYPGNKPRDKYVGLGGDTDKRLFARCDDVIFCV